MLLVESPAVSAVFLRFVEIHKNRNFRHLHDVQKSVESGIME